jgi:hypothetical protein
MVLLVQPEQMVHKDQLEQMVHKDQPELMG